MGHMDSFRTPIGVFPIAADSGSAFIPRRGYRLTVTREDASPYFFEIVLPVPEIFEVFRALAELLPEMVYPVLERPPEPDEDLPRWPAGRYASLGHYMPRRDILQIFQEHAFQLQNDGMLGAGLAGRDDENRFREVFIDEHKTLRFISESAAEVEAILAENRIEKLAGLSLLSEHPHAHRSLIAFDELLPLFTTQELAYDEVFSQLTRQLGMPSKHPVTV